jgi:hypothetical protein
VRGRKKPNASADGQDGSGQRQRPANDITADQLPSIKALIEFRSRNKRKMSILDHPSEIAHLAISEVEN